MQYYSLVNMMAAIFIWINCLVYIKDERCKKTIW